MIVVRQKGERRVRRENSSVCTGGHELSWDSPVFVPVDTSYQGDSPVSWDELSRDSPVPER